MAGFGAGVEGVQVGTGEQISVGVVLERRETDNKWADYIWTPVGVIAGAPPVEDQWRVLDQGEGWVHFHAATMEIELHRGETEGYKVNLSQATPQVYVVLREGDEEGDEDVVPFHVTVCPYEAEHYMEGGEEIVEGVAMPGAIAAWVQEFIDANHVDQPFKKRKLKPYDPRKGGVGGRGPGPGRGQAE